MKKVLICLLALGVTGSALGDVETVKKCLVQSQIIADETKLSNEQAEAFLECFKTHKKARFGKAHKKFSKGKRQRKQPKNLEQMPMIRPNEPTSVKAD